MICEYVCSSLGSTAGCQPLTSATWTITSAELRPMVSSFVTGRLVDGLPHIATLASRAVDPDPEGK